MSGFNSPSGVRAKTYPYEDFQGIDRSRDKSALDTGEKQHLWSIEDGYCDWRGCLVRDPGASKRGTNNSIISHVAFFGRDLAVWAQKDGGGTTLMSESGHSQEEPYPRSSVITSTVFNHKTVFCCRDEPMYHYDGIKWEKNSSPSDPRPAFATAVQRRLAIGGMPGDRTSILCSHVDNENLFPDDEDPASTSVTKAADIDIRNIIGTADELMGLGTFETNRLAAFTNDKTLVYKMHPDYSEWALDEKANINVGTLSHNTIKPAGTDLMFCSRAGVHSLRRSDANGVTLYSVPMSNKIDLLYRSLVKSVPNHEDISSVYDQDAGQYHIFFPQTDFISQRLTLTLNPQSDGESKWSTGRFLNARCAATLGGVMLLGTPGGIYNRYNIEDELALSPEMVVETPILWNGSITDPKESHTFILQATGKGILQVEAFDETGRELSALRFDIEDESVDDTFPDVPLSRQYERKFEHRYRGVQFRFTTQGKGLLKIIGFAVTVRK